MPNDFTRFDGYLGSQGLIYHADDQANQQTQTMQLQADRIDIGNGSGSKSIEEARPEFGNRWSQGDFSHGAGLEYFHRPSRDDKKFYTSEGFDISVPGRLTHLREMALAKASSGGAGHLVIANGLPFISDGTTIQRGNGAFPGTWNADSPNLAEGAQTVNDLATNGQEVFAAVGVNGIHKRDSAGTWTHHNDVAATVVGWVKDRLMAADGVNLYEVVSGPAAPQAIDTVPTGWAFVDIFEAGGFIYACVQNSSNNTSEVRHYGLTQDGSAIELKGKTPLPDGQVCWAGDGYLGQIYITGGTANSSGGFDPVVYQGFPDAQGFIQLLKLVDDEGSGALDLSSKAVAPVGESVIFGWSLDTASTTGRREGVAIHYLGRDALALDRKKPSPSATPKPITDIVFYKGRLLFMVAGDGLYYEDLTKYVTTATMVPSIGDFGNAGQKVWDLFEIVHRPLAASTSVLLEYSFQHPKDNVWSTAFTSSTTGDTGKQAQVTASNKARTCALRITSTANGGQSLAPEFVSFSVRANPAPVIPEFQLTRFVRLLDKDRKDELAEVVYQNPKVVMDALEALAQSWQVLTEADNTWNAWIDNVARVKPGEPIYDTAAGEPREGYYILRITIVATKTA